MKIGLFWVLRMKKYKCDQVWMLDGSGKKRRFWYRGIDCGRSR